MTKQRLDVWLHRARFFKTRSLAEHAVEEGAVRLQRNGAVRRVEKAAEAIGPGDVLLIATLRSIDAVRVRALAARRGPATEAQALYEPVTDR